MSAALAVRFVVQGGPRGGLVARGIDEELLIEAPSLSALEREARELVRRELGADRQVVLLLGARPPRGPSRPR
jgi:hypothetical protein